MLRAANWQPPAGVNAFFSLRSGGVSAGPYSSLNLGTHVGDEVSAVEENRRRLAHALPVAGSRASAAGPALALHWLDQVHGISVAEPIVESDIESGVQPAANSAVQTGDALYTAQSRQVITVMSADCLPVFFASVDGREIAIAHAGWRGLAAGVLEATLAKFKARPEQIIACLGPAIGPGAFEVGEEVRAAFMQVHPKASAAFNRCSADTGSTVGATSHGVKYLCSLYQLADQALKRAGVSSVSGGTDCTYTNSRDFFSYRRDGVCGRMASLIWLD